MLQITERRTFAVIFTALLFIFGSMSSGPALAQVSVLTQHNDMGRSGQNFKETLLNTSNVNVASFGKLFSRTVDGYIYAQPLYVPGLTVNGGLHNVVFVATEHNSVFAFDADDPNASGPLWQQNFGPSVPSNDVCNGLSISQCPYKDLLPEIGITSTPVIDLTTNTIYLVAKTKDPSNSTYHFKLHALDLLTGNEKFNGPVEITASVPGNAPDGSNGVVSLIPLQQHNRPGLLLLNGILYLGFGSVGDVDPFHGWILAYSASSLTQLAAFMTTPDASDGGFWGGGQGLASDGTSVYATSSNGTFDVNTGGRDYGDTVFRLNFNGSSLDIKDYFTPYNQSFLSTNNVDLGSGGPMLLPNTKYLVSIGKDGTLRLLDTTNLGQFTPNPPNNDVQEFTATTASSNAGFMGGPAYWNSPTGPMVYLWGAGDVLKAYSFSGNSFNTNPASQSTFQGASGYSNSVPLSVSANGSQAGTGIIWASGPLSLDANEQTVAGVLRAFDATNLSNELWDSTMDASRDTVGNYAKFNPPTVVDGKVYLATFSDQLVVYGLFNSPAQDFTLQKTPASKTVQPGQSATYSISVIPQNGFTGTVTFTCSGFPSASSCSFNPATVAPGGSTTLTVTTTAPTSASIIQPRDSRSLRRLIVLWLPLPGIALLGAAAGEKRRRRWFMTISILCFGCLLLLSACAGGSSSPPPPPPPQGGTPAGTYNITATAISGSLQHSTTAVLVVQ